jgi:acetyltransferase-like isoleucine patch superfamily enzyme
MPFYTQQQLQKLGLASHGLDVKISTKASIYNADKIHIGSNVRIDDFCVVSAGTAGIEIGNFVHLAVFSSLIGAGRIALGDFCGLSSRVAIYSSNEDYSGRHMTNPTIPPEFTGVTHADVTIGRHAIIGAGSIVLPGVTLEEGVAIGALSLVTKTCKAFGIYRGAPARRIGARKRDLLEVERRFLQQVRSSLQRPPEPPLEQQTRR